MERYMSRDSVRGCGRSALQAPCSGIPPRYRRASASQLLRSLLMVPSIMWTSAGLCTLWTETGRCAGRNPPTEEGPTLRRRWVPMGRCISLIHIGVCSRFKQAHRSSWADGPHISMIRVTPAGGPEHLGSSLHRRPSADPRAGEASRANSKTAEHGDTSNGFSAWPYSSLSPDTLVQNGIVQEGPTRDSPPSTDPEHWGINGEARPCSPSSSFRSLSALLSKRILSSRPSKLPSDRRSEPPTPHGAMSLLVTHTPVGCLTGGFEQSMRIAWQRASHPTIRCRRIVSRAWACGLGETTESGSPGRVWSA